MKYQTITRAGAFDAAHRVMNERVKCFNLHGHRFNYELTFEFREEEGLGYAIDFKEIKRVACAFIDDYFDHGMIANPKDKEIIDLVQKMGLKLWVMSLNADDYCNPSAEHISKELFMAISKLMNTENIWLKNVRLYETPNCWVDADWDMINMYEQNNFYNKRCPMLKKYRESKGTFQYDDREAKKEMKKENKSQE